MKRLIVTAVLVIVSIISIFVLAPKFSKPETYSNTISTLNEKQTKVLEMTGAAAAASLALGAVPGDATTPIANKVIDMAGYFIIILSVVILEKYMLTIAGYLVFTWLLPIICLLFILYLFMENTVIRNLAVKLAIMAAALFLLVPSSVRVSAIIEKTNEASIESTLENVKEIRKKAEETTESTQAELSTEQMEEEASSPFGLISDLKEGIDDMVEDTKKRIDETASAVTELSEELIKEAQDTLNDFVEVVVILLVTNCGIPILTLLVFVWILKAVMGVDLDKLLNRNMEVKL